MRLQHHATDIIIPSSILYELDSVMKNPDFFHIRKNDAATTAGVLSGKALGISKDLWLKRFNFRGHFDLLGKILIGSRARRLYLVSQKLYPKGLSIPAPIAYLEPTFLRHNSFYISTVIENSDNLRAIYKKGGTPVLETIAEALGEAIAQWHAAGAVHGDMKWSNILLQKSESKIRFVFVDLDQARLHRTPNIKGIIRDLCRFYRYGLELGVSGWVDTDFFPAYWAALPSGLKGKISLQSIRDTAHAEFRKRSKAT